LLEQFSAARLHQLHELTSEVEEDLRDIADGIDFVARHLAAAGPAGEARGRVLETLLGSVKAYRAAGVYGPSGETLLFAVSPRIQEEISTESVTSMARSAARAIKPSGPDVAISQPVQPDPEDWYRVFAAPIPSRGRQPREAIALLVDTRPFFTHLKTARADGQTKLLLLGPHGHVAPASSAGFEDLLAMASRADTSGSPLDQILSRVKGGESGTLWIGASDAQLVGFEPSEVVSAYAPLMIEGAPQWSAVTFTSVTTLRSYERAIVGRLGFSAALVALALIGLGAFVLISTRRSAVLRERLRQSTELAHLRERAEKTLESIPTCVLSLSGHKRLVGLNQALRDRIPTARSGVPLMEAFPGAPQHQVVQLEQLVDKALAEKRIQSLLSEQLHLFEEVGYYNLHAVPIEHPFGDVEAILVIHDLSEVRLLEAQLLRSEKLATVGTLAAGIAHEIGTPLGVVRGRAEYISGKLGEGHPQVAGLRTIAEQVDRIARTIQLLLDFSRAKPASVCPVELGPILRKVVELLDYEAERRKVHMSVDVDSSIPLIAADPDQLQQVLVNLVLNALDACPPGGAVHLCARAGSAEDGLELEHVCIEVSDNGKGIPPEDLVRVFDPFFTTKKRGQGTGLGLTMVSQIVRSHQARVRLSPRADGGTTATVLWPTASAAGEANRGE
jgi:nitrogen-specific signal transduction histidine kinase